MSYYKEEQYIPQVNENDEIIGQVERWQAHREGILHRGYTIALIYEDTVICQHRKHPVFGGFLDLTASSHQIYEDNTLMSIHESINRCLLREWGLIPGAITSEPKLIGKVMYQSTHGEFIEHEVCHLYASRLRSIPLFDPEYAYGISLIPIEEMIDPKKNALLRGLAPWVTPMIEEGLLTKLEPFSLLDPLD
ncbi:MAG: hypothetical protein ACOCXQ_02585 [Patescibacteria group bacterium]